VKQIKLNSTTSPWIYNNHYNIVHLSNARHRTSFIYSQANQW